MFPPLSTSIYARVLRAALILLIACACVTSLAHAQAQAVIPPAVLPIVQFLAPAANAKLKSEVVKRERDDRSVLRFRAVEARVELIDARSTKAAGALSIDLFDGRTI